MKKLILIATVLALAFSFLPKAEAGDTAELGLSVSFALEPLKLWTEPKGPFTIQELETLEFKVIAEDQDSLNVTLKAGSLPKGAEFIIMDPQPRTINRREGTFKWTPAIGQNQKLPYEVEFLSSNSNEELGLGMIVKITVLPQPVISIEINPTTWALDGVKLGEKRGGVFDITNVGNVSVLVDIGYGPQTQEIPAVHPGLEQGKDTFITEVVYYDLTRPVGHDTWTRVLPPDRRMKLTSINPSEKAPLDLVYGAPTGLSAGIKDHGVTYELRAYGDSLIIIDEPLLS